MNLKVRIKNPVFWLQIALAVFTPILAYFGLEGADLTTWGTLGNLIVSAVSNPYVLALAAVSVWSALNDPTTKGVKDSATALSHDSPA